MHFWISTYFDYQIILKSFQIHSNPYSNRLKTLGCPMRIIKFCFYWFLPMLTLHHVANPDRLQAWKDWKVAAQLLVRQRSLWSDNVLFQWLQHVTVDLNKMTTMVGWIWCSIQTGSYPCAAPICDFESAWRRPKGASCWKMLEDVFLIFFCHDAGKRSQQTFCFETSWWKCGAGHEYKYIFEFWHISALKS